MLRTDRYKLVVHDGPPSTSRARTGELYDPHMDPREIQNRWNDPAYRPARAELTENLLDALVGTENRGAVREAFW
jgi:arylsulfatase